MSLQTLPSDATVEQVTAALDREGAAIVADLLSSELIDAILAETEPYLARTALGQDGFSGTLTTRTGALIARSPTTRTVALHPLALGVAEAVLSPYAETFQLMLTQIIRLMPGQGEQPLHRDRWAWTTRPLPIEPQVNLIWALTDFTAENGATRVAPGSHRWPPEREAEPHEIVQAVMPRGSALIYTGSVIHGGGANRSDAPRLGLNLDYCLGWLRQEENQYLSCPPEVARTLEPRLQALIGYSQGGYALGYFSRPDLDGPAGVLPPEAALGRRSERAAALA